MGFAAGVQAGTNFVSKLQENERANRAEGRAETEYEYTQSERARKAAAREAIPKYALDPVSPVSNAPPTSVAATGGDGVPPVAPAADTLRAAVGLSTPDSNVAPAPPTGAAPNVTPAAPAGPAPNVTPADAGRPAPSALGNAPPAAAPAAPAVDPNTGARLKPAAPLSEDMKMARAMFNYARDNDDAAGMAKAREDIRTTAKRDYVNKAGEMSEDQAAAYVHEHLTRMDGMPIAIASNGKGGYTMLSWDDKGSRESKLNGAQIKQLVAADMLMKNGFADEGLALAGGVHKDLNDLIVKMNTGTKDIATANNQAQNFADTRAETARHNRATEANAAANTANSANYYKAQGTKEALDDQGNLVYVVPQTDKKGNVTWTRSDGKSDMGGLHLKPTGGAGGAPKEIPAAGTMMEGPNGTYQSDGKGGRLSVNAPLPADRPKVLKDAGFSGGEQKNITWVDSGNKAGEFVTFPGATVGYDVHDPEQMAQMRSDMKEAGVQKQRGLEISTRAAGAPARRAQRERDVQTYNNMSGVLTPQQLQEAGVRVIPRDQQDLYINTDE